MLRAGDTFYTIIGCMDGRIQSIVRRYGKTLFDAEYPDTITEAGFVRVFAKEELSEEFMDEFKKKLFISVKVHKSKGIIIHAHENCAGNPVSNEKQMDELRNSSILIKEIIGGYPEVLGIFLMRDTNDLEGWRVEKMDI